MQRVTRCYKFGAEEAPKILAESIREAYPSLLVQTVDPSAASNERTVEMIGEQTFQAGENGSPLAKKPEVDLLLRLGGTTQISRAIQDNGAKPGKNYVLVVMGSASEIIRLETKEASGRERLPRRQLDRNDLHRIERAALLNAQKN